MTATAALTTPPASRDPWTLAVCFSRIFLYANFMAVAACLHVLLNEWHISAAQGGAIVSSFTISYAVSLFVYSWAADHFGAKRMAIMSSWGAAAAALLFAFYARDFWSAFLLYGLCGLMLGGTYTPVVMLFAERHQPSRRGGAVGMLIASTSAGYAISLVLSGAAIDVGGYRAAFFITGIAPLVGTVILHLALLKTANKTHARDHSLQLGKVLFIARDARNLFLGYTAHSWELLGMWAFVPAFIAASLALKGASATEATEIGAYLSSGGHVLGAAASLSMGGLSDRLGRRVVLIWMAGMAMIFSFTIGWLIALPIVLLGVMIVAYSFAAIGDSAVLSTAITEAVPPSVLGQVLAVRSLAGFGAGAVAPIAFGGALDATAGLGPAASWGIAFCVLGIGGLLALICALMLERRQTEELKRS